MNITRLAETDIQDFIFEHEKDDEDKLVLKSKEILGVPSSWIASQIKGRKKSAHKIPTYYRTKGIVYPPSLNLEQSSSEATARFKAQVISKWISSRKKFCDLTGGFGVDSYFISQTFAYCDLSEPQKEIIEISEHNHKLLGATNIHYHNKDAVEFLANSGKHYDLVYLDPSRRNAAQKKVFRFDDCVPDVTNIHDDLYSHADRLIIKASPLLDIQQGIKDLQCVSRVLVVSVDNECKELVFLCDKNSSGEPTIECYDIGSDQTFSFKFSEERNHTSQISDPLKFIYEPNASIMKAGAFKSIAVAHQLNKIHVNTHLYSSDNVIKNFPGRIFEVVEFVKPDKKLSQKYPKANIILRNYPMTVEALKKKTAINDGGDDYLLGFTGSEKFTLIARRLK